MEVLHVDDDRKWRQVVRGILEDEGHNVTSTANLSDAKAAYERGSFDVVVCDGTIGFSRNGGYHWAKELQSAGQRVVMFSGNYYRDIPSASKARFEDLAPLVG